MELQYVELHKIADVIDCPHSSPVWRETGIPVIRNYNLIDGAIDLTNLSFVDENDYAFRTKRVVPQENDILFSREAPIGNVGIVPSGFKCCQGQRIVLIRPNKKLVHPEYLLAAFQSNFAKQQFSIASKTGSIVANFGIGDLKKMIIPLPSAADQANIASIISHINQKLHINSQIKKALSGLTKTIYEHYCLSAVSGGGASKDLGSNEFHNFGIYSTGSFAATPKGWSIVPLRDLLSVNSRGITPCYEPGNNCIPVINQKCIRDESIVFDEVYWHSGSIKNSEELLLNFMDILINSMGTGTLGRISPYISNERAVPHSCVSLLRGDPKKTTPCWLYSAVKAMEPVITNMGNGSTGQTSLNNKDLGDLHVVVPPREIMVKYDEAVRPMFEKLAVILLENMALSRLKNWVLPLLMNGQISINEDC